MYKRRLKKYTSSFFLFGPRGTGKSTWLQESYPDAAWIDLLLSGVEREYSARPERLIDFIKANKNKKVIIIDEIQKVPMLLSMVHSIMEKDKSLQFILTGSSARKLRQKGVDLLAGRAVVRKMHPFTVAELERAFDLDRNLALGMVPLVISSQNPDRTLSGYIDIYLNQEIKAEGMVRRLDDFSRFLEVISFSHGQVLNVAAIARECAASRNTVESYISILEDLLIANRIPVFNRRAKRSLVSHEKFFFFDCGVFCSLRPKGPIDSQHELGGPALEGLVLQNISAWNDYTDSGYKMYYWRTKSGNEVDLVLYGPKGFYAIEVKNSTTARKSDTRGLKAFHEDYPECKTLLLYRGKEKIEENGHLCYPVEEFLFSLDDVL